MKIGILTFHSQLNYGGVLQCWALQTVLEKMGHEVVVIDREFEHQIRSVKAIFRGWNVKQWIKFCVKLLLKRPDALRIVRYYKTVRFVRRKLHLTPYSFKEWKDAPKDLGVDLIVVGSDQVWNGIWNNLGVYLLQGAPAVPAIGYAISLGMTELPRAHLTEYMAAAKRFLAVGVREEEARVLLSRVGIDAAYVADPVLLADWATFESSNDDIVFCYFIAEEWLDNKKLLPLVEFARRKRLKIHVFMHTSKKRIDLPNLREHFCEGPKGFVETIARARYVLTDSFHGMVFSSVFSKKMCVLHTNKSGRNCMFSRIQEFSERFIIGECVFASIEDAIANIEGKCAFEYKSAGLIDFKNRSLRWLDDQLKAAGIV